LGVKTSVGLLPKITTLSTISLTESWGIQNRAGRDLELSCLYIKRVLCLDNDIQPSLKRRQFFCAASMVVK